MKILKQSPKIQKVFKKQISQKISYNREKIKDQYKNRIQKIFAEGFYLIDQAHNKIKGDFGEKYISSFLMSLLDTWVMFQAELEEKMYSI